MRNNMSTQCDARKEKITEQQCIHVLTQAFSMQPVWNEFGIHKN